MDFYIDETVYTGSPEDMSGRLPREVRTYALLDTLGISFTRVDHDATATIDACLEVEKILGIHICKNLFLCNAQKTRFYLLMMPGNKKFKTKNLSKQINSARLSFAGDEYMEQFLDITPGSVSILGLANDKENQVQLLIDSDVLKDPFLGCHPCINTSSLKIRQQTLRKKSCLLSIIRISRWIFPGNTLPSVFIKLQAAGSGPELLFYLAITPLPLRHTSLHR